MKRFGLIGFPLKNNFSVEYFTQKFYDSGSLDYSYENFPLEHISDLPDFLKKNKDLYGLNVTIPHKITVMSYLDELDTAAEAVGAVNCIRILRDEQLNIKKTIGYNTDVTGFEQSLKPLLH